MRLSVTTPQGALVEADVDEVTAPGALGEFGVLPGHVPFLSALAARRLRVPHQGREPRARRQRRGAGGGPRRGRRQGDRPGLPGRCRPRRSTARPPRRSWPAPTPSWPTGTRSWAANTRPCSPAAPGPPPASTPPRAAVARSRACGGSHSSYPGRCSMRSSSPAPGGPRARCAASWSTCACAGPAGDTRGRLASRGSSSTPCGSASGRGWACACCSSWAPSRPTTPTRSTPAPAPSTGASTSTSATPSRSAPPCATTRPCRHSGFAALKVKDAVVDALRDTLGARPDVDPDDPDVRVVLHLAGHAAPSSTSTSPASRCTAAATGWP